MEDHRSLLEKEDFFEDFTEKDIASLWKLFRVYGRMSSDGAWQAVNLGFALDLAFNRREYWASIEQ